MAKLPLNTREDSIQFINTATSPGVLTGLLTINHDQKRRSWNAYELHWGASADTPLSTGSSMIQGFGSENIGTEAAPRNVFNQTLVYRFNQTPVPDTASHLLVFATTITNEQKLYASRPLRCGHLLPASATQLERHLASTSGRLGQLPVLLDTLWDPSRCPAKLLPWLAWATSNDTWFDNKDDPVQESLRRRQLVRKSAFVHQHKGTRAAIQQALDAFANASITLTEWWEETPRAHPHTFKLDLLVNGNTPGAGTAELNNQLRQAIDAVKPVRSHYTFTLSTVQSATVRVGARSEVVSYKRFNMAAVI